MVMVLIAVAVAVPAAAGTTASGASGAAPACRTSALKVFLRGGSGGAAGSVYEGLDFVNRGGAACTLRGYPGVSFVDGAHHQVGAAARRTAPPQATTVTLKPGARASVILRTTETANYPPSRCRPQSVRGLRVYPPGQTRSAFVAAPGRFCSSARTPQLSVTAVVAGAPAG